MLRYPFAAVVVLACSRCLDLEKQTLGHRVGADGKTAEGRIVYKGLVVRGRTVGG